MVFEYRVPQRELCLLHVRLIYQNVGKRGHTLKISSFSFYLLLLPPHIDDKERHYTASQGSRSQSKEEEVAEENVVQARQLSRQLAQRPHEARVHTVVELRVHGGGQGKRQDKTSIQRRRRKG